MTVQNRRYKRQTNRGAYYKGFHYYEGKKNPAHRNKQYEFMLGHNRVAHKAIVFAHWQARQAVSAIESSRVVQFCSSTARNHVYDLSGKNQQPGTTDFKEALQSSFGSQPLIFNAQTSFFFFFLSGLVYLLRTLIIISVHSKPSRSAVSLWMSGRYKTEY